MPRYVDGFRDRTKNNSNNNNNINNKSINSNPKKKYTYICVCTYKNTYEVCNTVYTGRPERPENDVATEKNIYILYTKQKYIYTKQKYIYIIKKNI